MNSLKRMHQTMIMVGVITIMLFASIWLMRWMIPEPSFEYQNFLVGQEEFLATVNQEQIAKARNLYGNFLQKEPYEIMEIYQEIIYGVSDNVWHVQSSYNQVRDYAWIVLEKAQEIFGEEVQIVGTVYSLDSTLSALLNQPQSYLFFALNHDQTRIIAIIAKPSDSNVELELVWDYEQSDNLEYTTDTIEKLLVLFHEIA